MGNLKKVRSLKSIYEQGLIPTLEEHEVHPDLAKGSRENYLYFTFPVALNFQRSSSAMWRSALATYEDPETNYLFFPELVVKTKREKIQRDLIKHKLALQVNKHPDIWIKLANTFSNYYKNDPREFFRTNDFDVLKNLETLKIKKKDFPYLSGPKMSNYWHYILHQFTDAKFYNLDFISIIPDTHVKQCSVKLGIVNENASPEEIADAWFLLLKGSGISPIEMHPVLWNWSRNNFKPEI